MFIFIYIDDFESEVTFFPSILGKILLSTGLQAPLPAVVPTAGRRCDLNTVLFSITINV